MIPTKTIKRNQVKKIRWNNYKLNKKVFAAIIVVAITFVTFGVATFAWYIYNTNSHTTKMRMAAGSASSLLISNQYNGEYGYSTELDPSVGRLNPVSTDKVLNGFQTVDGYKKDDEGNTLAYLFKGALETDYYVRTLYLRSTNIDSDVYVSKIGYKDSDTKNPISASIRIGLVTYAPGKPNDKQQEFIFEINPEGSVSDPQYNTATGKEGYVIDSTKHDGSTIQFEPYTPDNYYYKEEPDGTSFTVNPNRKKICTCPGSESGFGDPVRIDVYIWMEGCDKDCYGQVGNLSNINVEFTNDNSGESNE